MGKKIINGEHQEGQADRRGSKVHQRGQLDKAVKVYMQVVSLSLPHQPAPEAGEFSSSGAA